MGAKSITFRDCDEYEGRDCPGISVQDDRVKWEQFYDDEDSALYAFTLKIGLTFRLRWEKAEGYTVTVGMGDAQKELCKFKERQHIDLAKSDAVDVAFNFLLDGAEEIDEEELNYRYQGDY